MTLDIRLIVLGAGARNHHDALETLAAGHPGKIGFAPRFDPALARLVYAGSDIFLMPSRYEPCGLGQMIALRYGTLPVVHKTGGLADTVIDLDRDTAKGNGFSFGDYSAKALAVAAERAVRAFREKGRARWNGAVKRGMAEDYSWNRSAERYLEVYRRITRTG